MTEQVRHTLRNSVVGAVAAAIVSALIPAVRDWVWGGLQTVGTGFAYCWALLVRVYPIPGWLVLIGVAFAVPALLSFIRRMRGPKEPSWVDSYFEDHMHSVVWRWRYLASQIIDLYPYCPACDAQLVYEELFDEDSMRWQRTVNRTAFHCEHCGDVKTTIEGDRRYVMAKVEREITRRIRTGDWKRQISAGGA